MEALLRSRDDDGARGGAGEAARVGDGVEDGVRAGRARVDLHGAVGRGGVIDDDGEAEVLVGLWGGDGGAEVGVGGAHGDRGGVFAVDGDDGRR